MSDNHHSTASIRKPRQREGVVLLSLLAIAMTAWCVGHGILTADRWGLPTTYLEPVYSDFIGTCGYLKSMAAGDFLPFGWKTSPDLGAPGAGNWNLGVTPEEALMGWFGILVWFWGLYPGINLGVLLGHLAAAATFYLVARRGFGIGIPWAFVGGLAFGLAPYQFAQQPHHLNCQYIWHLPLFPLVWKWIATGEDLSFGSRRLWQAMAIAFVTGLQNPYYSNIFCQLVLVCGAVRAWQLRSWPAVKPAALVIATVAVAFLCSNLDTLTYRLTAVAGGAGSPLIGQREYRWMDIYGLKLVDLFIPPITHHSQALARFGFEHRQASVLNDEEGSGYLGLLGIACLLFLVGSAVRALVEGRSKDVPLEAWWVLWIVIMFTTGGLNAIIAAFTGFTLFRTGIRYSIVVLLLSLLYAAQRMTAWHETAATRLPAESLRIATLTAAIGASVLVLWDQLPRTRPEQMRLIAAQVRADRDFVMAIERGLGATNRDKRMVFQLPVMDGTPLPGIPSSDHTRPFLYSRGLHFSGGATGEHAAWQQQVQQMLYQGAALDDEKKTVRFDEGNVAKATDEIRSKGFAAIYVNRNGYPDKGDGLQQTLVKLGYTDVIESPAGDLLCVVLRKAE